MTRTPWFNAQKQPPVNGGDDAHYERRCGPDTGIELWPKWRIVDNSCSRCQWRGMTKPAKGE